MEWAGSEGTGQTYYHSYLEPTQVENSVIDYDIENLQKILSESCKPDVYKRVAQRFNDHYVDNSRVIKRAFGSKYNQDFQQYNWGLSLTMDGKSLPSL